ncbi:unnamed protein product [Rotaria sp. Silwood1]|nr:unnamed protein product [Rotaria sp. Silwood1]
MITKKALYEETELVIPNIPNNARWAKNGITVASVGHELDDIDYQFGSAFGLSVDDDQTLVIADTYHDRIVQWKVDDVKGKVVAGGRGSGDRLDQLCAPTNVLIDRETSSLIISDEGNRRVLRWSRRSGTTHGEILLKDIRCSTLAIDDQRYLYIADPDKNEVRRYRIGDKNGIVVAGGYVKGFGIHQLGHVAYIFVDQNQAVYLSDDENHCVIKWNKDATEGIVVAGRQDKEDPSAQLSSPQGLFVDTLGTIYVVDMGNARVMRWSKGAKQGTVVAGGYGEGEEAHQLREPTTYALLLKVNDSGSEWDSLKITWGPNPFDPEYFVKQPRTITEAKENNYIQIAGQCEGTFLGQRFMKVNDYGVILIYDKQGTITGVQMGIPASMITDTYYKYSTQKMFTRDTIAGIDIYVLTAYFVDPRTICQSGRDVSHLKHEGTGTGLWLQNGSNPIRDSIEMPLYENMVNNTKWIKGTCLPTMGMFDNRKSKLMILIRY